MAIVLFCELINVSVQIFMCGFNLCYALRETNIFFVEFSMFGLLLEKIWK